LRNKLVFNGILTGNCSEIMLPSNKDESFVCCISAMNAEKWDEWKDTDAVRTAVEFLDAVMEEFIQKATGISHMQRAVKFAKNHRAIGLGLCGWHSLLQSKGYPFNSLASFGFTHSLMGKIRDDAYKASELLALSKGPPEAFPGLNRRNATLMAIAPNTSSSSIMGQISSGIEPFESNYYVKDLAKGSFTRKNRHLEKILEERGLNTDEIWRNIHKAGGSVLGVPELQDVHQVFLTFGEINQFELLHQAGVRQRFIDQGQSLNIHVPPGTDLKTINKLHIWAWESGVKALYYQRSKSASQGFSLNEVCSMCAG
jgi:ribonucleoside-diphosphate reductase alpha chain